MAWRDTEGRYNIAFCIDGGTVDARERWGMKMGMIWRIGGYVANRGYSLIVWV